MLSKYLYCKNDIIPYMLEYINSFATNLGLVLVIKNQKDLDNLSIDSDNSDNSIHIFVQSIPLHILHNRMNNIFLINTEQLTRTEYMNYAQDVFNFNVTMLDYSMENIQLLGNLHRDKLFYLPYQPDPREIFKLEKYVSSVEKKYDVVFVGCLSPKRQKIIDALNAKIKICVINNLWSDMRDKEIASGKILLNIHYDSNYNIYESLRCDRWTFAGMMVISEKSKWDQMTDLSDIVIFEDYDKIVNAVINIVQKYEHYYKIFQEKLRQKFPLIKENRIAALNYINEITI